MWQDRYTKLLKDEIEEVLKPLQTTNNLYELAKEPLEKANRGLTDDISNCSWPLLLLMVCEAISGKCEHALPAAASLQFLMAAGDVYDDIEDNDSTDSLIKKYGSSVSTNVATTLLVLAERSIARLKDTKVRASTIIRVLDTINSYYMTACAGQHLDLTRSPNAIFSEEEYIEVVRLKSATQVECACHIGALLADANKGIRNSLIEYGYNLGIAAQISNDIQGIVKEKDIINRNITLPVIFGLSHSDTRIRNQINLFFTQNSPDVQNPVKVKELLFHIGAIHYATVKLEYYKQNALDILSELETSGINVKRLAFFV